ncbi:MAG: cellulase family glycosylhydrolase [Bacteroidales bacterium]|nr:cellulase family glycosylhydrolase [Bacteroidales bacterium]
MLPVIDSVTALGVVAMIDYHDATGSYYEGEMLDSLKNIYRYLCDKYKNNTYVWFNIANEPGNDNKEINKWLHQHREVIKVVRDEKQADNLIVVDGIYWAQEFDASVWVSGGANELVKTENTSIIAHGHELLSFNDKTYDNIVFSIHNYDKLNGGRGKGFITQDRANIKLLDLMQQITDKNYALIIGEFGTSEVPDEYDNLHFPEGSKASINVSTLMNIGRVWWAWAGVDALDLVVEDGTNGGGKFIDDWFAPKNLSTAGAMVWDMTHWFLDLQAPGLPYATVDDSTSNSVTIDIVGGKDDIETVGFKVFVNGTFHSYAPNKEIVVSGLTPGTTYDIQVVAYDYALNASEMSAAVKVTTLGPNALDKPEYAEVTIYPNPVNNQLYITGLQTKSDVNLMDISGKVVYSSYYQSPVNTIGLDISFLKPGVYFINISGQETKLTKR